MKFWQYYLLHATTVLEGPWLSSPEDSSFALVIIRLETEMLFSV